MRIVVACLICAACAAPAFAQSSAPDAVGYVPVTEFDPGRDAERDIRDAIAEAGRSGRRVLLDVGGSWCVWCRRLDTLFVTDQDIASFRDRNFVSVKVNYSKENKNEKVLSRYPRIQGYPHLFVLDADGTLLRSQGTAELELGKGHDPGKVMAFLKAWAPPAPPRGNAPGVKSVQ